MNESSGPLEHNQEHTPLKNQEKLWWWWWSQSLGNILVVWSIYWSIFIDNRRNRSMGFKKRGKYSFEKNMFETKSFSCGDITVGENTNL